MTEISAQWNAMSAEEQNEATNDALQELKDHKEMRALALQNVPINAFHDARGNIQAVKTEVRQACLWFEQFLIASTTTAGSSPCSNWRGNLAVCCAWQL